MPSSRAAFGAGSATTAGKLGGGPPRSVARYTADRTDKTLATGPHVPEWVALRTRLSALSEQVAASGGYVVDVEGNLWCSAYAIWWNDQARTIKLVLRETGRLEPPLGRGGKLDRRITSNHGNDFVYDYVRSFAGLYVLALTFSRPFDIVAIRRVANKALPAIESLVLALPPPGGPAGPVNGSGLA